jgi:hypothetical protein
MPLTNAGDVGLKRPFEERLSQLEQQAQQMPDVSTAEFDMLNGEVSSVNEEVEKETNAMEKRDLRIQPDFFPEASRLGVSYGVRWPRRLYEFFKLKPFMYQKNAYPEKWESRSYDRDLRWH